MLLLNLKTIWPPYSRTPTEYWELTWLSSETEIAAAIQKAGLDLVHSEEFSGNTEWLVKRLWDTACQTRNVEEFRSKMDTATTPFGTLLADITPRLIVWDLLPIVTTINMAQPAADRRNILQTQNSCQAPRDVDTNTRRTNASTSGRKSTDFTQVIII